MATITPLFASALDFAKRMDPDGAIPMIVEQLKQRNPFMELMPFRPTNGDKTHTTTRRTDLPAIYTSRINTGTVASKSDVKQVEEKCYTQISRNAIDTRHKDQEGDRFDDYRLSEEIAHVQAHSHNVASELIYGTTADDPESIDGIMTRYSSPTAGEFSDQVIDAGGSGADNCSILLVHFGEQTVHGIFPKNSVAGLRQEDLGKITITDTSASNAQYEAYVSVWTQSYGLCVRDGRAIARVGSIDYSTMSSDTGGSTYKLTDLMIQLRERTDYAFGSSTRPCFMMPRPVKWMLHRQAMERSNAELTLEQAESGGEPTVHFAGIPIHSVDAMTISEALV